MEKFNFRKVNENEPGVFDPSTHSTCSQFASTMQFRRIPVAFRIFIKLFVVDSPSPASLIKILRFANSMPATIKLIAI